MPLIEITLLKFGVHVASKQANFLRVNIWAKFYCFCTALSVQEISYILFQEYSNFSISQFQFTTASITSIMSSWKWKMNHFFTNSIYFVSLLHNSMTTYLLLFLSNPVGNNFTCGRAISIIERNTSSMNVCFLKIYIVRIVTV